MNMVTHVVKLLCDRLQIDSTVRNDLTFSRDKYYLFRVECRSRGQPLLATVFSLEKSLLAGLTEIMLTKLFVLKQNIFVDVEKLQCALNGLNAAVRVKEDITKG